MNDVEARGEMYEEFKKTVFYEDLRRFLENSIQRCQQETVEFSIAGDYEKAKKSAHELSGYKSVISYIDDCINIKNELKEEEKFQKDYDSQVRSHV